MSSNQYKQPVNTSRIMLFGVWFCMVAGIIVGLSFEDRFFAISGKPVAVLSYSNAGTTFRAEDDVKWKPVAKAQGFFDGDRVATGPTSKAKVSFGEGRLVELAPDTIIAISSIREASGNSFIINLVKGGIKPTVPGDAKHALVVMSGTSTFVVEPGEERGFAKPIGGALHEFNAKDKFPAQTKKTESDREKFILPATYNAPAIKDLPPEEPDALTVSSTQLALASPTPQVTPEATPLPKKKKASPSPSLSPSPTLTPTPAPPKAKPQVDLSKFAPAIVDGSVQPSYMTTEGFGRERSFSLAIKVGKPQLTDNEYRPVVQVSSGEAKSFIAWQGPNLELALGSDFLRKGVKNDLGAIPCTRVELRTGVKMGNGAPVFLSDKPVVTKICSLRDAESKVPLKIGLTTIGAPSNDGKLYAASPRGGSYPIQLIVTRSSDYLKLVPYMKASSSFQISQAKELGASGIFSVDSSKVLAQFGGVGITAPVADKLMSIMGHSFVFKGNRSVIQDVSGLDLEAFKQWIAKQTSAGKNVYIRAKSNFIPVSRNFMNERGEVAEFVKKASGTIFLDKVLIIAFK